MCECRLGVFAALELELEVVVSLLTWILGSKLGSLGRAASTLNTISLASICCVCMYASRGQKTVFRSSPSTVGSRFELRVPGLHFCSFICLDILSAPSHLFLPCFLLVKFYSCFLPCMHTLPCVHGFFSVKFLHYILA